MFRLKLWSFIAKCFNMPCVILLCLANSVGFRLRYEKHPVVFTLLVCCSLAHARFYILHMVGRHFLVKFFILCNTVPYAYFSGIFMPEVCLKK